MTACKLCLKEKDLCKSHIYPEYMYKHCYDNGHTYIEFDADKKSYNRKRRKGIYEKLLCRDCEDIIMEYENYAKPILYDEVKPHIYNKNKGFITKDYDYLVFKLFVLSLLWRASISTQKSYQLAKLGPYEEKLRVMLLNKLNTEVSYFPSVIFQTFIDEKPADGVFVEIHPSKSKIDNKTIYQFVADGIYFFIGVGEMSIKNFPKGSSISPESLRIGSDQLSKITSFIDIFASLQQQGKFSVYENQE